MEAKVVSVSTQGSQPVVLVEFIETEENRRVGEKSYYLDPGQTIESIKPQIKEDLDKYSVAESYVQTAKEEVGKKIDLEGVKSTSELKEEVEKAPAK